MLINLTPLNLLDSLVAVLILFAFLRKYAFPPIMKAVRDRQERVESDLKAAEQRRLEAEQLKQELEQQLKDVKQRAEAALTRALRDAEEEAQQVLDRARTEAKRMVDEAGVEIRTERERALHAVKHEVASLAMEVAEKVLSTHLSEEQDQALFQQFADELGSPS